MLVSSAGAATQFRTLRDLSVEEWARTMAVDLSGTFHVLRHGLEPLKQAGGGSIVVIGSIGAQMVPSRNAHGAAAKAGVEALVRVAAREEARNGIRANVVAIGITDTDMAKVALGSWGDEITQRVTKGIPLGRIGTPEDVANAVVFLLGEEGAYITGKVLQVDGGQLISG
jgi:NAD(P)-dependent dehydrogenase (short-subunit alcohol dehydrogenase family)